MLHHDEEISSAAILATKKSAGVPPKVNLREYTSHTYLPSANKAPEETSPEVQKQGYQ